MSPLFDQLDPLLKSGGERETTLNNVLGVVLTHFQSETGTIHRLDVAAQVLRLVAQKGLPPQLLDVVGTIPVGKGIAGQVAAQNKPVTICNLQTDTSGVAKPGARQTGVGGSLCVPIRLEGALVGTFGVGTRRIYEYTLEEAALLEEVGEWVAPLFKI
jgi:GAF domain-containing protein